MRWPSPPGTELAGGSVRLTGFASDDAAGLFGALDDKRVWEHLAERPGSAAALALKLMGHASDERITWVVRLSSPLGDLPAGSVVGTSSYLEVSRSDSRLEIGSTAYAPSVWGTQVNPQTKLLLLAHAFDDLGAGRVQLKTDVRNTRSQQAIARLGATYEGTLRRYQRRADGSVRDTVLFSITAEEWPEVRRRLEERLAA
jgi:RimJ/RimL family protein N-acetyltransferase